MENAYSEANAPDGVAGVPPPVMIRPTRVISGSAG